MTPWKRALEIATPQGGAIDHPQLRSCGFKPDAIARLVRDGHLHPRHEGVYALGRSGLSPYGEMWAAYLATNGRGAVSEMSALAVGGAGPWPKQAQVVVRTGGVKLDGVKVRRTRLLPAADTWRDRNGLLVCTWTRAVVDMGATSSVLEIQNALDGLDDAGRLDVAALKRAVVAHPRPGQLKVIKALEPFVTLPDEEYRSLLERFAARMMRRVGLREFVVNQPMTVSGRRVVIDFWFADARLAVEVDGRATHDRARQFQSDRDRDRALLRGGIRTARFTWQDVMYRPAQVIAEILQLIAVSI